MPSRTVLIVHAHPEPRSLNAALKDVAVSTLLDAGHSVEVSDLYSMRWKAAADADDFTERQAGERLRYGADSRQAFESGTLSADIRDEQAKLVRADALILHLNPVQEAVQPGGDRNWAGVEAAIAKLTRVLPVPVIAKEVGSGISGEVARRLVACGVAAIDGGTAVDHALKLITRYGRADVDKVDGVPLPLGDARKSRVYFPERPCVEPGDDLVGRSADTQQEHGRTGDDRPAGGLEVGDDGVHPHATFTLA
mgnify:CR=1 FL=1